MTMALIAAHAKSAMDVLRKALQVV